MLLALLLAAAPTVADANAAGMKLYQARRYPEAIAAFQKAIELEADQPSTKEQVAQTRALALAHFNLGCALALARKAGKTCEVNAYLPTIWEHVLKSIALDPNRFEKALTDSDLAVLRETLRYQSLLGLSPARESDLPKLLPLITWYGAGEGAFGSTRSMRFTAKGGVSLSLRLPNADGLPTDAYSFEGRWTLKGRELKLVFPKNLPGLDVRELTFSFTPEGTLGSGPWSSFSDGDSECEA
ncbi:MAG: hypothetical protein Q8N26_05605 [Myxococcales bacterium]|nr:hypothetical protein [Myxococcales bacterium]